MGQEIVVWSDEEERICVADAVCPHLGSHLGPSVGGVVRDGCLVCPFHGFTFDTTGQCVATPHAEAPKTANLSVYETREMLGMVFAWWGAGRRPPQWHLPDNPTTGSDWSKLLTLTLQFRGHPQETTENSVDLEHLGYIHGYGDIATPGSISIDGAYLKSCFNFKTVKRQAGLVDILTDHETVTHVHGLGYSFVEIQEKTIPLDSRLWVLATPIDGQQIEFVLVSQVRNIRKPGGRFFVGLEFLPSPWRGQMLNRMILQEVKRFVEQDIIIWERKQYQSPPRLSQADGPIGIFRRYCRQFYPLP